MKKTILIAIAALFGIIVISSCKKDANQDNNTNPANTGTGINAITAPAGFLWASSRTVNFSASITDKRFGTAIHTISVYDADPYNGGKLIATGSATTATPFATKLYLASTITQIYVVKTSPDNSKITQKVDVGTADVVLTFGDTDPTVTAAKTSGSNLQVLGGTTPASPDCTNGCTVTIGVSTNNVSVNNGDVVCITGNNIIVSFANVNGGTVRVCGTNVILQNYNFSNGSSLIVTTGGSVVLSTLNFNSSSSSLTNFGTVNYSGAFPDNGIFSNYGTFNGSGDFNLNSNAGTFTNNGTMNIAGSFNSGSPSVATNNGSIVVSGNFQQNASAATFVNNCSLIITGNYNQSGPVKNYSLIKVNGTSTINSSTQLGLYNTAMLKTVNFILDGSTIAGFGSTSLVKITGNVTIQNSGASITGPISVCSNNPVSTTYMTNGAAADCSLYVPVTGCNGDGNGSPQVVDTDGDGVPDSQDAYPTDPTKAYNNSGGTGTVAFEDQWPNKGDYDLNDVVMTYNYNVVTNAHNVVVQVTGNYSLVATGGTIGNGFGIQFPIARTAVTGLTGGTLEAGQTNAVVTLFTNMRNVMTNWNTQPGVTQSPAVPYTITFNVTNGPALSAFGQDGYNPFIWNMGADNRRRETHLAGKTPTTLADATLFGTGADNTNVAASRYYVTTTGLPFAISIPTTFSYPIEGTDITSVYLHFAAWAQSGGTSFTDWYSNTASGYRNSALIYTH
jgi:LruC domain-containing protein